MTRPRGRPRKSDDPATRDRLLEAAAEACVAVGFDTVTLADVAARAGVTPAAVYNHFAGKDELLYTAGRLAIDRLSATIAPTGDPARAAHEVVHAFLRPSFGSIALEASPTALREAVGRLVDALHALPGSSPPGTSS